MASGQRIPRKAITSSGSADRQPFITEKEILQPSQQSQYENHPDQAPLMSASLGGPVDLSSYDYHPEFSTSDNTQHNNGVAVSPSDKFSSDPYYQSTPVPTPSVPELSTAPMSPVHTQNPQYPQYPNNTAYGGTEKSPPSFVVPVSGSENYAPTPVYGASAAQRKKKIIILSVAGAIVLLAIILGIGLGVGLKKHHSSSVGSSNGGNGNGDSGSCPGGRLCESSEDCNGDTNGSYSFSTCQFLLQCNGVGYCT